MKEEKKAKHGHHRERKEEGQGMKLYRDIIAVFKALTEEHNRHIANLKAAGVLPKDTQPKTPEEMLNTCILYFAMNFYSQPLKRIREPESERLFKDILRIATIQETQELLRRKWEKEGGNGDTLPDFFADPEPEELAADSEEEENDQNGEEPETEPEEEGGGQNEDNE